MNYFDTKLDGKKSKEWKLMVQARERLMTLMLNKDKGYSVHWQQELLRLEDEHGWSMDDPDAIISGTYFRLLETKDPVARIIIEIRCHEPDNGEPIYV